MDTVKKEVDIYIVEGKEFLDKQEARKYEESILDKLEFKYYLVDFSPDLTEGTGWYKSKIFASKHSSQNKILQHLIKELGQPVIQIMLGVDYDNWVIRESHVFKTIDELNEYINKAHPTGTFVNRQNKRLEVIYLRK